MDTCVQGHGYVSKARTSQRYSALEWDRENTVEVHRREMVHPIWKHRERCLEAMTFEFALRSWIRVGLNKALTAVNHRVPGTVLNSL